MKAIYLLLEVAMFFSAIPMYFLWKKCTTRLYRPNLIGWICIQAVAWTSVVMMRSEHDLKQNWGVGQDLFLYFSGWMGWYCLSMTCIAMTAAVAAFAITPVEFINRKMDHEDQAP